MNLILNALARPINHRNGNHGGRHNNSAVNLTHNLFCMVKNWI